MDCQILLIYVTLQGLQICIIRKLKALSINTFSQTKPLKCFKTGSVGTNTTLSVDTVATNTVLFKDTVATNKANLYYILE